jgi:hypothetical protein
MLRSIGVALVFWSAAAAAGPSGRVLRVERSGISRAAPRLCQVHGDSGNCVGEEPQVGQSVTVLDEHRVIAELKIVEATSFSPSCPMLWSVKTRVLRGIAVDSEVFGVIDPHLDPNRAHVLDHNHIPPSPSGAPDEEVWRAIDRDGDGVADILITRYGCDSAGRAVPGGAAYCVAIWARTGARMTRTTQLNFAQCTH